MSDLLGSPIPPLESVAERLISPIQPGPPDAIPGFLPRQGQLVIAGETNVGKSLVALEVCSALTTGQPLWGELVPNIQAKKILYVLGEHYSDVIKRLWAHTGLPMSDTVWLMGPEQMGADKWLVAGGKQNYQSIGKFKRWAEGCDLIVFDPFSAFVTGIDVENDNVQMRMVLDSMSLIAQTVGAACLVLAHQGKPSIGRDGQEYTRKSYAIRGASAIEDAATNIFYMGKADGTSGAAMSLPPDMKVIDIICRKYKGETPSPYHLLRDPATLQHKLLGNRPNVEVMKIDRAAKVAKMQAAFPDMPFSEIIRAVASVQGCSESTIRRDLGLKL